MFQAPIFNILFVYLRQTTTMVRKFKRFLTYDTSTGQVYSTTRAEGETQIRGVDIILEIYLV